MYDSKVFQFFRTFSPEEKRVLKKFIHSPVHNPNETLSKFYDYIDSKKALNGNVLQKEKVFRAIFEAQEYEDVLIRRLMSEFFGILEDFTVWYRQEKDGGKRFLSLSKHCRERNLPDLAKNYLVAAEVEIAKQETQNAWFHLEKYAIQEERFWQNDVRTKLLNIQEMSDDLSDFFAAEMLRIACAAASHRAVYKTEYSLPYLSAILTNFEEQSPEATRPLVRLYYTSYVCLTDAERTDKYLELKQLLIEAEAWLNAKELGEVFIYAINFCIRRLNMGDNAFFQEVFDLYKIGLERNVFLENGQMSRFTYKNIVSSAIKLGELAWVLAFIEKYTPLLAENYREPYQNFCLARYFYSLGDFEQAQPLLQNLQSDDVFLELDGRVLLMKIWFEMGEWRLLQAFFKTFRQFISRKKLMAYHLENYKNILFFTQKIANLTFNQNQIHKEEGNLLKIGIEKTSPLTEKEWLLTKVFK
jgi:hypothetical protein